MRIYAIAPYRYRDIWVSRAVSHEEAAKVREGVIYTLYGHYMYTRMLLKPSKCIVEYN
jgi:hypothetical protein